jgi:pyruvate dehydrogenase E1 component alpha subunit
MVRFHGHFEGDAQTYKAPGENDYNREHRCCLKMFAARVTEAGVITRAELEAIDKEAAALIEEAVATAKAAPLPGPKDLLTDVYVSY